MLRSTCSFFTTYSMVIVLLVIVVGFVAYQLGETPKSASGEAGYRIINLPYQAVDLEGALYHVTRNSQGSHTGDALVVVIHEGVKRLLQIAPDGEMLNSFRFDWDWGTGIVLSNGNYLMGDVDQRVLEVDPLGDVVWELEIPGLSHQVTPLKDGNLLVVMARLDGFKEITRSGETIFEWYAKDHIAPYSPSNFEGLDIIHNRFPNFTFYNRSAWNAIWPEWTHLNYAQKLPNGNFIVSLRNQDLVVEISGTDGEILWSWGPGIIKHQHTPVVYENFMYVLDNGNGRVVKVDRSTGKIVLEIRGLLAPMFGDVRRLQNGNLLITDSFNNRAIEVDEDVGEIVWEIQAQSALYRVWAE